MLKFRYYIILFCSIMAIVSCGDNENVDSGKQYSKVLTSLNKKIKQDTTDAGLYYQRAMYYYKNNSNGFALEDMRKAIDIDSTQLEYWFSYADILLDNFQSKEALVVLKHTLDLFPESDDAHIKLAHFQFITKQYLQALGNINQVIRRNPTNPKAFFEKAKIYDDIGDSANAMINYQRTTELNSDNRAAWIAMGDILAKQNNKLAINMYQNAIDIDPRKKGAYLSIALYYHMNGNLSKAREEYLDVIRRFPQYPVAHFNLGLLYLEQDSVKKAYQCFNNTVKVDPTNGDAYLYRGITYKVMGDTAAARNDFVQAQSFLPEDDKRPVKEMKSLE